jgi:hypothetical protein
MIDVRTVKGQNLRQLAHESRASSFNTEDLEYLNERVGVGPCRIHAWNSQDLTKSRTAGIEEPLSTTDRFFIVRAPSSVIRSLASR